MVDSFLKPFNVAPRLNSMPSAEEIKPVSESKPSQDAKPALNFKQIFDNEFTKGAPPAISSNAMNLKVSSMRPDMVDVPPQDSSARSATKSAGALSPANLEGQPSKPSNLAEAMNLTVTEPSAIAVADVQPSVESAPQPEPVNEPVQKTPEDRKETGTIESPPAKTAVSFSSGAEKANSTYFVKPGDTLSHIVTMALKSSGKDYTVREIYDFVSIVAEDSGIKNPNRIYVGQKIDLSAIYEGRAVAATASVTEPAAMPNENVPRLPSEVQVPVYGRITSRFGMRDHPILETERFHTGVDIAVPTGEDIRPMMSGMVVFAGVKGGYGNLVEIDHGNGMRTRYGHLSDTLVKVGDYLSANQVLGLAGQTGYATGPHLHFEVRQNGQPIDPLRVIPESVIVSGPASDLS
jgi:murein DD-endopeptidase MepM/ murein hydrolase activator NlpD